MGVTAQSSVLLRQRAVTEAEETQFNEFVVKHHAELLEHEVDSILNHL
jgi:hypothetical protein